MCLNSAVVIQDGFDALAEATGVQKCGENRQS